MQDMHVTYEFYAYLKPCGRMSQSLNNLSMQEGNFFFPLSRDTYRVKITDQPHLYEKNCSTCIMHGEIARCTTKMHQTSV